MSNEEGPARYEAVNIRSSSLPIKGEEGEFSAANT